MKYCPNPDCDYLRRTGSIAEYQDQIIFCLDCGDSLVEKSKVKKLLTEIEFTQDQKWYIHWRNRVVLGIVTGLALATTQLAIIFLFAIAIMLFSASKHPVDSFEIKQPWLIIVSLLTFPLWILQRRMHKHMKEVVIRRKKLKK